MSVKSGQACADSFVTVDGTGALTAATGTPAGTLYVNGVANGASVTVTGSNPYKWAVTLPSLTAGDLVSMYITATVSGISTGGFVWQETSDTKRVSDLNDYAGGDTSGVTTLLSRVVGTIASGTHNAQSGDSYARLGAPAGASVSADVAAVKAQTAAIETDTQDLQTQVGTNGAGLTNIPWNASWDAEVQSEATDALNAYDPPTNTEMAAAFTEIKGATWSSATDTLEHIRDKQTDIETDTQDLQTQIGTDGAGLTAIGDTRLANLDAAVSSRLATASYTAPLDAAGTRTALGMASADLDTQLDAIVADTNELQTNQGNWLTADVSGLATSAALATVDGNVDAIKAKTDLLSGGTQVIVVSALAGSALTITRGDTLSASFVNVGSVSGYANIWFTVKRDLETADSAALVQIDTDTGLLYANGVAASAASGSITVDDAPTGDLTIALAATVTATLPVGTGYYYDIQWMAAGGAIHTLASGVASVAADVTRSVA